VECDARKGRTASRGRARKPHFGTRVGAAMGATSLTDGVTRFTSVIPADNRYGRWPRVPIAASRVPPIRMFTRRRPDLVGVLTHERA